MSRDDIRIMLFGLSGSGKTSLLHEIKNRYSNGLYITFGDVVLELCKERKYNITSRDQILRDLEKKDLIELQKEAYKRIIERVNNSNAFIKVIDNHLILRMKEGYVLGFTNIDELKNLNIDYYYYIYCNPKVLKSRIEADTSRKRNIHEADIHLMHDMSMAVFSSLVSVLPQSKFFIIDNTVNSVKNIADVFIEDKLIFKTDKRYNFIL